MLVTTCDMIERYEKCGKSFMDKSEANRHKMYEHIVPVSPFEEIMKVQQHTEA